jgi:tetratricopeptide (TPR) repeat protein
LFCFLFYLLTIWPVLHLLQMNDSLIYDRFMYLPSIGLYILLAHGLAVSLERIPRPWPMVVLGVFLGWLVFLMAASHRQTRVWNNSATLWDHVIRHYPKAYAAYNNMGFYLEQQGRFDEAMLYYMRMIEVNPKYAEGYFRLGNILALRFDRNGALRYYSKAIEYNPKHYVAYNNRGNQYLIARMYDRALADYTRSIDINDKYVSSYVNRGMCYFAQNNYELALRDFQKVLQLDPHHAHVAEKVQYINGLMSHER